MSLRQNTSEQDFQSLLRKDPLQQLSLQVEFEHPHREPQELYAHDQQLVSPQKSSAELLRGDREDAASL